jgi:hypothetical protein
LIPLLDFSQPSCILIYRMLLNVCRGDEAA